MASTVFHFSHIGRILRSAGTNRFVIQLIIDYQCLNFTNTECNVEANGFSGDSISGHVGQSYILSCSCQNVDLEAVTYTWMKNDSLISGETVSTLTLSQLMLSDAGIYSCSIELNGVVYKSSIDITIQSKSFFSLVPRLFEEEGDWARGYYPLDFWIFLHQYIYKQLLNT